MTHATAGTPGRATAENTRSKALAALPLPRPQTLGPLQLRGAACVWCSTELHGDTAEDLGQRYGNILGVYGRWFPRGCRECTLAAVQAADEVHPQ